MNEKTPALRLTSGVFWLVLFAVLAGLWILGVECGQPYWEPVPVFAP